MRLFKRKPVNPFPVWEADFHTHCDIGNGVNFSMRRGGVCTEPAVRACRVHDCASESGRLVVVLCWHHFIEYQAWIVAVAERSIPCVCGVVLTPQAAMDRAVTI